MICPSCGAPMHPLGDVLKCDYCGNVLVPDKTDDGVRLLAEAPNRPCPICAIPLMQATLDQVSILYCNKCRGLLIPMHDFTTLIENERAKPSPIIPPSAASADDLTRRIACPQCRRIMDAHFYAGGPGHVVIDSCEQCLLIWLDHGKLNRLAHAANHLNPSPFYPEHSFS